MYYFGSKMEDSRPLWKVKAAAKRAAQLEAIPKEWRLPDPRPQPKNTYQFLKTSGILSEFELKITESTDAKALLEQIANQELSAVTVVTAFCKHAAIAHQLIGCCTEIFFEEAISRAGSLDYWQGKHQDTVGPLHGLPVSVKDVFNVKGYDTTIGTDASTRENFHCADPR